MMPRSQCVACGFGVFGVQCAVYIFDLQVHRASQFTLCFEGLCMCNLCCLAGCWLGCRTRLLEARSKSYVGACKFWGRRCMLLLLLHVVVVVK